MDDHEDNLLEVEEAQELQDIVSRVVASGGRAAAAALPRWRQIVSRRLFRLRGAAPCLRFRAAIGVEHAQTTIPTCLCNTHTNTHAHTTMNVQLTKYQEQPQLLDGCLEALVLPLAELLRRDDGANADAAADGAIAAVCGVCRLLHVLAGVRGHKTVVRFFPHAAADLERALALLLAVKARAEAGPAAAAGSSGAGIGGGSGGGEDDDGGGALAAWEAQGVLLLWLSILILTPFDLRTVDSSVGDVSAAEGGSGSSGNGEEVTPLAARVVALCQGYLEHPGAAREMAALLLARLLTRPDMAPALAAFLSWQAGALAAAPPARLQFLLPGVLQALALAFKLGRREVMLPHAPRVWAQLGALWDEAEAAAADGGNGGGGNGGTAGACLGGSSLARRLAVKLAQRLGLTLLAPRLARWRYRRRHATLLGGGGGGSGGAFSGGGDDDGNDNDADAAAIDVAPEVEEIIGCLLAGLRDRDTAVRWAASKGVARVTGCLPAELGADVVDGVMALFGPAGAPLGTLGGWHDCCPLPPLCPPSPTLSDREDSHAPLTTTNRPTNLTQNRVRHRVARRLPRARRARAPLAAAARAPAGRRGRGRRRAVLRPPPRAALGRRARARRGGVRVLGVRARLRAGAALRPRRRGRGRGR